MRTSFAAVLAAALLVTPAALAGEVEARAFVEQRHVKITQLLRQPASSGRDAQVEQELGAVFDYDELTRRIFGKCPPGMSCLDNWTKLSAAQQQEMTDLFRKLVQKTYRKNLVKTLDYDVSYKGSRAVLANESKVRTEAKSRVKPRDPAVLVDYVVREDAGIFHVVDIVTEGSSLATNYREQVAKMLREHDYAYLRKKISDKANAP